jgi:hypothetical protein
MRSWPRCRHVLADGYPWVGERGEGEPQLGVGFGGRIRSLLRRYQAELSLDWARGVV